MILTNARVLTFDAANRVLDSGSVEIRPDGTIGAVTRARRPVTPGEEVVDAGGRLLMPALINCHTHLYSTLARGIALPGRPPKNFPEILRKLWWRLDRALNPDDVYYSALVGLDRFRQVRRRHADRSPLQPERLRRQPGPHRAGVPRSRTARRPLLRDLRPQRGTPGGRRAFARMCASSSAPNAPTTA